MTPPTMGDTIVAIATAWSPAALGVVRLSGPAAFELCGSIGARLPAPDARCPFFGPAEVEAAPGLITPALVYWFRGPASYTGQDIVELHLPGCLPLLRTFADGLLARGARRALPGEFTARALRNGKLRGADVQRVFDLIHAADAAAAREAARTSAGVHGDRLARLGARLLDLVAELEAGIDFVDEEDVRFVTAEQLAGHLAEIERELRELSASSAARNLAALPHVALAGLPNAGKSTLFNALLGQERAIVSPVIGTTRDVLSAELDLAGLRCVLQDTAGLGAAADELELSAHLAAEGAADTADLVLWVHEAGAPWPPAEIAACDRIPADRRLLVLSKVDQCCPGDSRQDAGEVGFGEPCRVSSLSGRGMQDLADRIRGELFARAASRGAGEVGLEAVSVEIRQAVEHVRNRALAEPELVALTLREAWNRLSIANSEPTDEQVLTRILARFCLGK
ncbi:MAG: 50S ribosome-binding GTPase [Phycisphaerae bacterium]|nr:50S ribosome-binding GTPase [Phycisphaerae bacterium]MCZ2399015.1 50S ribosome-binding GTPase [Phycisphaerae bacterium]